MKGRKSSVRISGISNNEEKKVALVLSELRVDERTRLSLEQFPIHRLGNRLGQIGTQEARRRGWIAEDLLEELVVRLVE